MGKRGKGSAWEREICGLLSEWFSCGRSDDWFWRSATSGGRATVRGRKGKTTTGHCGDIAATCRQGERLTSVFAIELKRGYNKTSIGEVMDRPNGCSQQQIEGFIEQAYLSAVNANCFGWLLFQKRDRRSTVVWMERKTEKALIRHGALESAPFVRAYIRTQLFFKTCDNDGVSYPQMSLVGMNASSFFELVPPSAIISLSKEWRNARKGKKRRR